ncbi:maltose alpha-D-glucosyltransferase [Paractinoplanes maris]|uniref:maltose alpha-D-glucosyltransferase n=1 Tax=Paractinoplanes maris TaxID=1734446 RepID=UPI0020211C01|nr:maltose alpha-D-glucosyltransferase [Actinoplanes maris]
MTEPVRAVTVLPVVSWPQRVEPGQSYLVSVDLTIDETTWPYDDEELAIGCMIDGRPLCEVRALGDPGVVLHRFGGTYGPAQFIAHVSEQAQDFTGAALWLTLTTSGGVPFHTVRLPIDGTAAEPGATIPGPRKSPVPSARPTTSPDEGAAMPTGKPADEITVLASVVEPPTADDFGRARSLPADRTWFQRAVFYEVLVQSFYDSNSDGWGDLRGLIERVDYLQWLGVDCLLLAPIFDSPWHEGGHDIRDFYKVSSELGTVEDFVALLDVTHKRGIRVVCTLVLNHTSDQHPWFQESRREPDGPYGDFYVWSDTGDRYPEARLIEIGGEEQNWTFDPIRRQYFWHRFSRQEPDLNFDNPAVQEAVIDVLRFWLDLGTDGLLLGSVPYLFERDGTASENLPETHAFLKHCRNIVDIEFPGRVLMTDANQWPADLVEYFGDPTTGGDEMHMAYHYPLMPRIFMAVRRESRFPISEIMAQTPAIPGNCQWGIFLRSHDELTLELLTDEERDYMYSEYSKDPRMKANSGIRRRLAPLLNNDRNQIQLFTALLLSLPGSPMLYYGDEIGMGDNIWLGNRDALRTPMQWTPDRNAGFSTAEQYHMHIPANSDTRYGYTLVNVENQRDDASTLLNWTRTMLAVRRRHEAFGAGTFRELGGSNPSMLAFLREDGDDVVLCVNNLSRFSQPIELNLQHWNGYTPVELFGHVNFPRIGQLPYLLTVPGHGFYWFQLCGSEDDQ